MQLKKKGPDCPDDCIHDAVFPIGRKHVNYGADVINMEILGLLFAKSLMKTLPKDQLAEEEIRSISNAFFVLFKLIVYWLQYGFHYETRHSLA